MAQTHTGAGKAPTASEMQEWFEQNKQKLANFDAASNAIKALRDKDRTTTRRIQTYNKERVVEFLKNINGHEADLRNLAWYLFFRSQIFERIILYFATLIDLDARSVIPAYSLVENNDDSKMLKSYYDTLKMLNSWNINNEFLKVAIKCLTQDVSYNVAYYDETGLYLLPIPEDYCRIRGQYLSGDFAFAMDLSYFNGQREWLVEAWGEPFRTMWRHYQEDKRLNRWQDVPDEYAACFKYRNYDWEDIVPPFSGLFLPLINLEDVTDTQAVADAQDIYKLIWYELETITGAKMPDEWRVDPESAVEYFNRMIEEALPDYASAAMVPGKLNVIDFSDTDKSSETNKVLNATKQVLNTSGGAQILNAATISGTTAFNAAIKADAEVSLSTLLPQFEGWFNRIIGNVVTNPAKIHFFHVGRLSREEFRKELLESAQYSLPTKLAIMSLSGIDELSALSLNHLEENILKLGDRFNDPLKSSYTQSGNSEGGRPTSDDGELTDDGEASRDKSDRM